MPVVSQSQYLKSDLTAIQIDVSLIVNVHAGLDYLRRTMLSLEEASHFAAPLGIRCELLFVMDRSPPEVLTWVQAYHSDAFVTKRIIEVSNGSLGLSRNDGILSAAGEFVLFCDEDDLVSFNIISECYFVARAEGPNTVVIPEYFVVFHDFFYIQRYFGSGIYSPLSFITEHPFTSRIFIHHSVRESALYTDVRLGEGFAYEDYHFNSKLAALGFRFVVAPNTIIFYRHRRHGLQQSMKSISTNQIPQTPLFEPSNYLKVCAADYTQCDLLNGIHIQISKEKWELDATCLELTRAANWPAPGSEDTELGVLMEPEVGHGETEVYARVQA